MGMGVMDVTVFLQSHFLNIVQCLIERRKSYSSPSIFGDGLEFRLGNGS